MQLSTLDWWVLALYGVTILAVGLAFARRAGGGREDYFLAGRTMPWWLIGTSMVATTFSADTPNLVIDLVRSGGVSQNWVWWAFVITGMCTVFFYAKLWRRSGVLTDIGFYEVRYAGRSAAFLRAFRAVYLGVFFNVMIMATVTLAAIKIGGVLLGVDKYTVVLVAGTATVIYSATSGLWGVLVTDLLLFTVSMIGSVGAAVYTLRLPEVGGLSGLMGHPNVVDKLSFLPDFSDPTTAAAVFIVPIAVQWWSTWYPGAEPGGGGYTAQRMLAAKDEKNAMQATLWFNVAHYSIRPWPWILVALASLIVYPTLSDLTAAFPNVDPSVIGNDLAYPAMLVFLPHGLLGLVVASLAAAYMSTISTHLNWGASYVVDDVYRRFVAPDRGGERLREGGPRLDGRAHRTFLIRRPSAGDGDAGVSDPPSDRRRNRAGVFTPLVLVAHQHLERDLRDGDLVRRRRVLRIFPHAARFREVGPFGGTRGGCRRDDGGLARGHLPDIPSGY